MNPNEDIRLGSEVGAQETKEQKPVAQEAGFGELLELASEAEAAQAEESRVAEAATAVEVLNRKTAELKAEQESQAEMRRLGEEILREREQRILNEGRFSYLGMVGDKALYDEKKVPEKYQVHPNMSNMRDHGWVDIGGHPFKLEHPASQPANYLEAYDKSMEQMRGYVEDAKGKYTDLPPDELLEKKREGGYSNGDYEAYSKRDEQGQLHRFAYRDFPKDIAIKMFNANILGPDNTNAAYRGMQNDIQKSLEGFGEAALEMGDAETALEAYSRLGKLDDPKLIEVVKSEVARLKQSEKPTDKTALSRLIEKIKAFGQAGASKK